MATLTTPRYGFPYPDGTERVMDGDNAIGALAQAIEDLLLPNLRDVSPAMYRATGQLVLTSSADSPVPGMVVPGGGLQVTQLETALLLAACDINIVTAGVGNVSYAVFVDGVSRGGGGTFGLGPTGVGRASILSTTLASLPPGTHTIDVRARKSINAGVANVESASVGVGNVSQSYLQIMRFKAQPTLLAQIAEAIADTFPTANPAELER
jgi:hypothetical protein